MLRRRRPANSFCTCAAKLLLPPPAFSLAALAMPAALKSSTDGSQPPPALLSALPSAFVECSVRRSVSVSNSRAATLDVRASSQSSTPAARAMPSLCASLLLVLGPHLSVGDSNVAGVAMSACCALMSSFLAAALPSPPAPPAAPASAATRTVCAPTSHVIVAA